MSMAYNDLQTRAFTQIAYMDLGDAFDTYSVNGEPVNLGRILSSEQKTRLENLGIPESEFSQWSLAAVHDANSKNGMYACVIETSPGNAAVAFRGSEAAEGSFSNLKNDWIDADLGLLNSTQTTQQAEVDRFLRENSSLLNQYDNLMMTGHSLGGNLAEYATVVSQNYGLDDNVAQCISMDGPGFSQEFIDANYDAIMHMGDKMTHYRYSFVGGLLNDLPLPEGSYRYLNVSNDANHIDGEEYNMFTRHDTKYLDYDPKTGMFRTGTQDDFAQKMSILTKVMDALPKETGDYLRQALSTLVLTIGAGYHGGKYLLSLLDKMIDKAKSMVDKGKNVIENGIQFVKDAYDKFKSFISGGSSSGSGGGHAFGGGRSGGRGGSGGRADRIVVSTEDMANAIQKYRSEKERLMEALSICNEAAKKLANSWAGPSFAATCVKMASAYKNLHQSNALIDDAIDELSKTIQIMEKAESGNASRAAALDIHVSPFA